MVAIPPIGEARIELELRALVDDLGNVAEVLRRVGGEEHEEVREFSDLVRYTATPAVDALRPSSALGRPRPSSATSASNRSPTPAMPLARGDRADAGLIEAATPEAAAPAAVQGRAVRGLVAQRDLGLQLAPGVLAAPGR